MYIDIQCWSSSIRCIVSEEPASSKLPSSYTIHSVPSVCVCHPRGMFSGLHHDWSHCHHRGLRLQHPGATGDRVTLANTDLDDGSFLKDLRPQYVVAWVWMRGSTVTFRALIQFHPLLLTRSLLFASLQPCRIPSPGSKRQNIFSSTCSCMYRKVCSCPSVLVVCSRWKGQYTIYQWIRDPPF